MKMRTVNIPALILMMLLLFYPGRGHSEEDVFEKGLALMRARQYDQAIEAFSEVIEMIPEDVEAYNYRGIARAYEKDYEGAIDDYTRALTIKPGYAQALNNRGFAWVKAGNLEKALNDFSRAIELEPHFLDAYTSKAWILATSSDPRYRNGKQAVALAKKAVDLNATIDSLDTLSAAYAADAQFDQAIDNQKKAIALMIEQDLTDQVDPYIDRLKKYKARRPLRISYAAEISSQQQMVAVKKPPEVQSRAQKPSAARPHKAPIKQQKPPAAKPLKVATKQEKPPASGSPKSAGNPGPLPYTIQVSAYRDLQKSMAVATKLKKNGDPAFTCPVLIPGKGKWHRVFVGFYQSLDEARKAAGRLKKRKFHYVHIAKKPLAVQVALTDSYMDAREFKSRLRDKGYMAYSLLDRQGRKKTRILIGAYSSKDEARQLIEKLQKDGFTTTLLPR